MVRPLLAEGAAGLSDALRFGSPLALLKPWPALGASAGFGLEAGGG